MFKIHSSNYCSLVYKIGQETIPAVKISFTVYATKGLPYVYVMAENIIEFDLQMYLIVLVSWWYLISV